MSAAITGPLRVIEHHLLVYRRVWKSNAVGSIIRPLMYVLGMGLGVGTLVDEGPQRDQLLNDLTYFEFFAPAIIATTAMMVLTNDSLWPIRGGFFWFGTFHSQASSPLDPAHIASGVLGWHFIKGVLSAGGVSLVLILFSATRSWGLLLATLFGAVAGVAYSAPLTAWSAQCKDDMMYPNVMRFLIMPMFLFSGAFYPLSQLPQWMQLIARCTPIWHGVELTRGATHGLLSFGATVGHLLYLTAWIVVGWVLARREFIRKLRV